MASKFQKNVQLIANRLSSDIPDEPEALHAWFEIRGIPWDELKEVVQVASGSMTKEAALAYGLMLGWELHAEAVSKDVNS